MKQTKVKLMLQRLSMSYSVKLHCKDTKILITNNKFYKIIS